MGKETSIDSIDYRSFLKETSIDYREDGAPSQQRKISIAERLMEKLQEPASWKFYLKCAYHLSEDQIWQFVELATRPQVKSPNRYFVYLANKAMK